MSAIRISAIIPNYNHAQFLPRCLDALLAQASPPDEIIVVDDASTDNSLAVIQEFAQRHPIIRCLKNEKNQQICRTMNRGIELAAGDYVGFFAADDEVRPGLFEHARRVLGAHPYAGFCSGIGEFRDTKGLKWYMGRMPKGECYMAPQDLVILARSGHFSFCSYNAVFRKSALSGAGSWIPELRTSTDWFGMTVIAFRHGMCYIPKVLSIAHVSPQSSSQLPGRTLEACEIVEHVLALLATKAYADVAPLIRHSGALGAFGWPLLRVMARRHGPWDLLNGPLVRQIARRLGEHLGRRFLPQSVARFCLKCLYGKGASSQ